MKTRVTFLLAVAGSILLSSCLTTLLPQVAGLSPFGPRGGSRGSPPADVSSPVSADDRSEFMRVHNEARAQVGAPPLAWSQELADFAQQWAEQLARRDTMQHRQDNPYGENLCSGSHVDAGGAARMWLAERSSYDANAVREGNYDGVGHYTQMIWRGTTAVGYGIARSGRNTYIVANYAPPGNIMGQQP